MRLPMIVRANTDRIAIIFAACTLGAAAGISLVYLGLMFCTDNAADF